MEHASKDNKLDMLVYELKSGYPSVFLNNFRILLKEYNKNKAKRKIL